MNEPSKTEKKPWEKPELIVLVRSTPEELVLAACKYLGKKTAANTNAVNNCSYGACTVCSANSTS